MLSCRCLKAFNMYRSVCLLGSSLSLICWLYRSIREKKIKVIESVLWHFLCWCHWWCVMRTFLQQIEMDLQNKRIHIKIWLIFVFHIYSIERQQTLEGAWSLCSPTELLVGHLPDNSTNVRSSYIRHTVHFIGSALGTCTFKRPWICII